MKSITIINDKNQKSKEIKNFIKKNIKENPFSKNKLIIVIGGDGFMLETLKKNNGSKNLFYGINSGNYGFLMNKFSYQETFKNLANSKKISISPLEMSVKRKNGKSIKSIAINEVSILRQSKQASTLMIKSNSKVIIKKLVADGVLISTPAGSTAYNLSVHGPILNLDSKKIAVSPISPFRPRRWKGKILKDSSIIKIQNLDMKKRPISIAADNFQVKNAKSVVIKMQKKIKFNLLYNQNNSLQKKIKLEQVRKEFY